MIFFNFADPNVVVVEGGVSMFRVKPQGWSARLSG